jgi:hypothetical protein
VHKKINDCAKKLYIKVSYKMKYYFYVKLLILMYPLDRMPYRLRAGMNVIKNEEVPTGYRSPNRPAYTQ